MTDKNIRFLLFGPLRDYCSKEELTVSVPHGSGTAEIKFALSEYLPAKAKELLPYCALADEDTLLGDDYHITADARIAVLPPVCGG